MFTLLHLQTLPFALSAVTDKQLVTFHPSQLQIEKVEEPVEDEEPTEGEEESTKEEGEEDGTVEDEEEEKSKTKTVDKTTWDYDLVNDNKPLWTRKWVDFLAFILQL